MVSKQNIVCVTGASGTVGSKIAKMLTQSGYHVRLLQHKTRVRRGIGEIYKGSLLDESSLEPFLSGCQTIFHCGAEIRKASSIWKINVEGTKRIFNLAQKFNIKHFCYISSVGVYGPVKKRLVDEEDSCNPLNAYEQSKYAAEKIVSKGLKGGRVVILRPTNIVSETYHGVLEIITRQSLKNTMKLFLIGGEMSHIIHVDNVAAAAIHCINLDGAPIERFIVSCDHDPNMKFRHLKLNYPGTCSEGFLRDLISKCSLPITIPFLIRNLLNGKSNKGDVTYSAKKLIDSGFDFPLTVNETLNRIAAFDEFA